MKVGINCGHTVSGTVGSGIVGYINESDETRVLGYKLMDALKRRGVTVVDCTNDRADTVTKNLKNIVDMANAQPLDLFVSIHFNGGGGRGSEVFTYNAEKFSQADMVCKNMAELGFVNRGIKNGAMLYVVRNSKAKAMLIEVCFADTASDVELYKNIGADRVAEKLCDAIVGKNSEGELTMSQYEELKKLISTESARVDILEKEIKNLDTPMVYNYIDANMPDWAKEAVQWCVDNGIIMGTGSGLNLDYTQLWTCVVIYRLAKKL